MSTWLRDGAEQLLGEVVAAERSDDVDEQDASALSTLGYVRQCDLMSVPPADDKTLGLLVGLSGGAVVAICAALIAWLKWRHPPKDS